MEQIFKYSRFPWRRNEHLSSVKIKGKSIMIPLFDNGNLNRKRKLSKSQKLIFGPRSRDISHKMNNCFLKFILSSYPNDSILSKDKHLEKVPIFLSYIFPY